MLETPTFFNLLHYLAICRHPTFLGRPFDIVKALGKIFLQSGCHSEWGLLEYQTPLYLAVETRNLAMMEILVDHGARIQKLSEEMGIERVSREHDVEVLELLLNGLQKQDPESFEKECLSLLKLSAAVPLPERRLREGGRYRERGRVSIELFLNLLYRTGQIPADEGLKLLSATLEAGNDDLFHLLIEVAPDLLNHIRTNISESEQHYTSLVD